MSEVFVEYWSSRYEFCQKCNFQNVNFAQKCNFQNVNSPENVIFELWILQQMWFLSCEFCHKCDFQMFCTFQVLFSGFYLRGFNLTNFLVQPLRRILNKIPAEKNTSIWRIFQLKTSSNSGKSGPKKEILPIWFDFGTKKIWRIHIVEKFEFWRRFIFTIFPIKNSRQIEILEKPRSEESPTLSNSRNSSVLTNLFEESNPVRIWRRSERCEKLKKIVKFF